MSEETIARFAQMGFSFLIALILLRALLTDIADIKKNITSMFGIVSETKADLVALKEDLDETKDDLRHMRRPGAGPGAGPINTGS